MPLLTEHERVPDITLGMLAEIVVHLPESDRNFVWFLVLSGCRIGEYLRLTRAPLKPQIFGIDVPGTKTSGSRRQIYIAPSAWGIVDALVPCDHQYGQLRRLWRDACGAVGVSGVTLHDLRHVGGQTAADAGMPLSAIKDHLGHATIAMAERSVRRPPLKEGAALLGGVLAPHLEASVDRK